MSPFQADADKLAAVRDAIPSLAAGIYLNTGSVGPLPAETAAAMAEIAAWERDIGRAHVDAFPETLQRMAEARAAVAALMGTDVPSVALTHSTTDGLNAATLAIDWGQGDRAVTTRLEHPGGLGPLYALRASGRASVELLDVGDDGDDARTIAAFDAAIGPGTRLVSVSHVAWTTGAILPVAAIAEIAHARGALIAVDGAQAAGAIPTRFDDLDVDLYALPAQKWLLGPEGMGALLVGPRALERLTPAIAGSFSFERVDGQGSAEWWPDARRFEWPTFHRPSVGGMARSIGWMSMFVGLDFVYRRGLAMARRAAERLAAIPGVVVLTPPERMATLVTFTIAGWSAPSALDELGRRTFAIARTIPGLDAIRISVGFFTSEPELERFCEGVELLASHTPETLPQRRTLEMLVDS